MPGTPHHPPLTAGLRTAEFADEDARVRILVLYPSATPEQPVRLGAFTLSAAPDAAVAAGSFPPVVISHGSGGSYLLYRGLALHLARRGFVVLCPEHPGNNRSNNELAGTFQILCNRPRQVTQTLDWAHADPHLAPHLGSRAAVIGHSLGGYTALAVAGGHPAALPGETPDPSPRPVPVAADPRIQALVLLAPATPWFQAKDALRDVRVPVLMYTGEQDSITSAWHGEVVKQGLPGTTELVHQTVPGAGHYSFLTPFPVEMTRPDFPPSQDPPGFDRRGFHERLSSEIEAFLRRRL